MKLTMTELKKFIKEEISEAFRGSDEEREMMDKMTKKDFVDYVTRGRYEVPDRKGDMGELEGMEGPFQFSTGAVLYYDPREGKYYDRGRDMYISNDELASMLMESKEK